MKIDNWKVTNNGWYTIRLSSNTVWNTVWNDLVIEANYRETATRFMYLKSYHGLSIKPVGVNCQVELKLLVSGILL